MKKLLLSFLVLIVGLSNSYATHNRAGEITYRWLSGYTYEITVTTYTNTNNTNADRCELVVYLGNGDSIVVPRINGPSVLCPTTHDGVMYTNVPFTKLNIYRGVYTYGGPGVYTLTMEDQNRNAGVDNIPNSVNTSFSLRTELNINPFLSPNSSPVLTAPPLDQACVGVCFEHNPTAYDPDGDSLYYRLSTCYAGGVPIPTWSYPPNMNPNSIDHNTGDLVWCSPNAVSVYNIAIVIEEWKLVNGTSQRYFIGSVLRDMQIDVVAGCLNTPPEITSIADTCIEANSLLSFNVTAVDPGENITLSASGGPFTLNPAASFSQVSNFGSVTGTFTWTPNCTEIRLLPYLVTFKAEDNNPHPLVNFEAVNIRVIAPAPQSLSASPSGSSIILNWAPPLCSATNGTNPLKGYLIYRKESCDPWVHSVCETGVPSYTGYILAGTVTGPALTFTDNNNGLGLLHGINYSYIVVAFYNDGSQSYASANTCAQLVRDVPIITNVSVLTTGAGNGSIWTHWVKPLGIPPNLDTLANPGPYQYRLMKARGQSGTLSFSQVAVYTYNAFWQLTDTGFVTSGLNTQDSAYTFRVDFYSNGVFKGSTHTASSVFLSSSPSGNHVTLNWQQNTPWMNYKYFIYKEIPTGSSNFVLIGNSTTTTYTDAGLVNGVNYCYKVQSEGEYSDPALPRPLFNTSQIKCETPVDIVPPCQPDFNVASDCDIIQNVLSWTNPNTYCSNDAVSYNIYFARTVNEPLQLLTAISDLNTTSYTHVDNYDGVPSIAGCYAVTAVDSSSNESIIVKKLCVDNCPFYDLPNVFTPNGDNTNDFFTALPYRFVKDVDIKIYDRWGLLMFETTDPDVKWDGKNASTKKICPDGTYFYVGTVNESHVDAVRPRPVKGFIQLINTKTAPSQ
jgi:gliding motility-associated-like protein